MTTAGKLAALDAAVPPVPWAYTPVTELMAMRVVFPKLIAAVEALVEVLDDAYSVTPEMYEECSKGAAPADACRALLALEKVLS